MIRRALQQHNTIGAATAFAASSHLSSSQSQTTMRTARTTRSASCFSSNTPSCCCNCCNFQREQRRFQRHKPASAIEIGDALRVLGCTIETPEKELKKKYKELVKKHHPDMGGNEEMMKKVTTSYKLVNELSRHEKMSYSQQAGRGASGAGMGGFGSTSSTAAYDMSHKYGTYSPRAQNAGRSYQTHTGGGGGAGPRSTAYDFNSNVGATPNGYQQKPFTRRYSGAGGAGGTRFESASNFGKSSFSDPFGGTPYGLARPGAMKKVLWNIFGVYLVGIFCLSLLYRSYLDYLGEADWQRAEKLSRSDTVQDLGQVREEIRQRLRERQQQYLSHKQQENIKQQQQQQHQVYQPVYHQGRMTEEGKTMRAMDFAAQQQTVNKFNQDHHNNNNNNNNSGDGRFSRPTVVMSDKSRRDYSAFPSFDRRFGYTHHYLGEPVGVVYFEPSSKVKLGKSTSSSSSGAAAASAAAAGAQRQQPPQGSRPAGMLVNPLDRFPQQQQQQHAVPQGNLSRSF